MTQALQAAIGDMLEKLLARRVMGEWLASSAASRRVMARAELRRTQPAVNSKAPGPEGEITL